MRTKLLTLLIFLMVCFEGLSQTTVLFTLSDFGAAPATNRNVSVQMISPFIGNVRQFYADSNGQFYMSNAQVANYQCYIKSPPGQIPFMIGVLSTNLGVVDASTITLASPPSTFPAGNVAWSILASDQRYAQSTNFSTAGLQHGNQNITNWGNVSTNAYLSTNAAGNFQPSNANLTNWANLSTNVIGTGGGSGTGIQTNSGTGIGNSFTNAVFMNITNLNLSGNQQGNGNSFVNGRSVLLTNSTGTSFVNLGHTIGSVAGGTIELGSISPINDWAMSSPAPGSFNHIYKTGSSYVLQLWSVTAGSGWTFSTNGFLSSYGLESESNYAYNYFQAGSNFFMGNNRMAILNTNNVSVVGAGSSAANGTYVSSANIYTNAFTGSYITNNGSSFVLFNVSGSSLYTASALIVGSPGWTISSGSSPRPTSVYGAVVYEYGNIHEGPFTSTNLTWQITNAIAQNTLSPTNSGNSGQVLGLTGSDVAWIAQSSGGGGSNSVSQGNNLVSITTNSGNFAVSGISQTNGFTTLATTNPTAVLMTNIFGPSSNQLYAAIGTQINSGTNAVQTYVTNHMAFTNDSRVLSLSNANSSYYGSASLGGALFMGSGSFDLAASFANHVALTNDWSIGYGTDNQSIGWFHFINGIGSPGSAYAGFVKTNGFADPSGNLYLSTVQTNVMMFTNQLKAVSITNQGNRFAGDTFAVVANPTFRAWTNSVAIYGSFEQSNNTTYIWNGSVYTNVATGSYEKYNGSGWNIITRDGVLQYALSGASPVGGTWTVNTGPLPAPTNSSFGYELDVRGGIWQGEINSTNLDQRLLNVGATLTNVTANYTRFAGSTGGQSPYDTNNFFMYELFPKGSSNDIPIGAILQLGGPWHKANGTTWFTPTNATLATADEVMSLTNSSFSQEVWVIRDNLQNSLFWLTNNANPSTFPIGPWYPDTAVWSANYSITQTNQLFGSLVTLAIPQTAQQAREAFRVKEITRSLPWSGNMPILQVAVSQGGSDAVPILTNAINGIVANKLVGVVDVVEIDRWTHSRDPNNNQVFITTDLTLPLFANYVHNAGLKAGVREDYGTFDRFASGGQNWDASYPFYERDASNIVCSGVDFVSIDTSSIADLSASDRIDRFVEFCQQFRKFQIQCQRPFFIQGALNGSFQTFENWMLISDAFNIGEDVGSASGYLTQLKQSQGWRGPGKYPMMVNPGQSASGFLTTNTVQARRLGAIVGIGPANLQLLNTNDLTSYVVNVLTNEEWRAIWKDSVGSPGWLVSSNGTGEVWARELSGGQLAVSFINLTGSSGSLTANWNDLKISSTNRTMICRDVFERTNTVSTISLTRALDSYEGSTWILSPSTPPIAPLTYATMTHGTNMLDHYTGTQFVFINITNWTSSVVNGFTANTTTGMLTNLVAGTYEISYSGTVLEESTAEIASCVFTNGVQAGVQFITDISLQISTATSEPFMSAPQIFDLPANCRIELRMQPAQATQGWRIRGAVLYVKQIK